MVRSLRNIITVLTLITTLVITVRQLKDAIDSFRRRKEAKRSPNKPEFIWTGLPLVSVISLNKGTWSSLSSSV